MTNARKTSREVRKLIDMGKEKGYLTYEEVQNALNPTVLSTDQIDDMMMLLEELDIELVDDPKKAKMYGKEPEPPETKSKSKTKGGSDDFVKGNDRKYHKI